MCKLNTSFLDWVGRIFHAFHITSYIPSIAQIDFTPDRCDILLTKNLKHSFTRVE